MLTFVLAISILGLILIRLGKRVFLLKRSKASRREYTDGYFMISTSDTNDLIENDELNLNNNNNDNNVNRANSFL